MLCSILPLRVLPLYPTRHGHWGSHLTRACVACCPLHNCNTTTSVVFWECLVNAHRLTELVQDMTDDSHANRDYRRGEDQSRETQKHSQLSCRRPGSPTTMYCRSDERARITMRPQTKYAHFQGTPSSQISVTFGHFNYQPIIWHRGPRLKAHWYMCANVANSQNHHNYSPLSMSDVLITQTFSSWGSSSRRYFCNCPG